MRVIVRWVLKVCNALLVMYALFSLYRALTPTVKISMDDSRTENRFALMVKVENAGLFPMNNVSVRVLARRVELERAGVITGTTEEERIGNVKAGDFAEIDAGSGLIIDNRVIQGVIDVAVDYKVSPFPKLFTSKKVFYASPQLDGSAKWLAQ